MLQLRIVQESAAWVVIDKPAGFHTHPPEDKSLRINPRWNSLGILERQLGQKLFPMHRLDRATSGLLLFSKNRAGNKALQKQFSSRSIRKTYFALARGTLEGNSVIDASLKNASGELRAALTCVQAVHTFQLPLPHPRGGYRTFTLLEAHPETGRFHQIRRHLSGLSLPLIGDSRHGDRKLNREFAALTNCEGLFLRCMRLEFDCPESGARVKVRARWSREWHRLFDLAGACPL